MPRKKRKPITPTGRPLKEIDWKVVDHKLRAGCFATTIAAHFDISTDTLYERVIRDFGMSFTAYSQQKRMEGDDCLKTTQYEEATVEKNTTLLVWLGKVRLDQKEIVEAKTVYPNDEKLAHEANETKLKYELLLKAEENKKLKEELDGLKRQANPIDQ